MVFSLLVGGPIADIARRVLLGYHKVNEKIVVGGWGST